jgi:hypothetical protein
VSRVLSLREPSISLQALDFKHARGSMLEPRILETIVSYAISHNVQQLGLSVSTDIAQIPDNMFSCQTLTHLKLAIYSRGGHHILFPESLNLPALTSLQLENLRFCAADNGRAEPFSTFNKLSSLLISNCTMSGVGGTLCISNVTLVNFTLYNQLSKFYKIDLCYVLQVFAHSLLPVLLIRHSRGAMFLLLNM